MRVKRRGRYSRSALVSVGILSGAACPVRPGNARSGNPVATPPRLFLPQQTHFMRAASGRLYLSICLQDKNQHREVDIRLWLPIVRFVKAAGCRAQLQPENKSRRNSQLFLGRTGWRGDALSIVNYSERYYS
jgi:hypothetical protein